MPQMAPLTWTHLMVISTTSLILISAALFWAASNPTQLISAPYNPTKMAWKW